MNKTKSVKHMTSQLTGLTLVTVGYASACLECGQSFDVTQHNPSSTDNSIMFCPFCGKPIDDCDTAEVETNAQ
jgi:hypothetical protein